MQYIVIFMLLIALLIFPIFLYNTQYLKTLNNDKRNIPGKPEKSVHHCIYSFEPGPCFENKAISIKQFTYILTTHLNYYNCEPLAIDVTDTFYLTNFTAQNFECWQIENWIILSLFDAKTYLLWTFRWNCWSFCCYRLLSINQSEENKILKPSSMQNIWGSVAKCYPILPICYTILEILAIHSYNIVKWLNVPQNKQYKQTNFVTHKKLHIMHSETVGYMYSNKTKFDTVTKTTVIIRIFMNKILIKNLNLQPPL